MADNLLSPKQLALLLGVATVTVRVWRQRRQGPPYHRVGGRVKYRESDVAAWLESNRVAPERGR